MVKGGWERSKGKEKGDWRLDIISACHVHGAGAEI